ncbi:conjugal transfer protein TrbH [Desulfobacter hydrogenophilus]|uniref:Conjugal transfer protein TrbH n=1 Tax=Desulfobacter hydrogenophilus TaxID=2291 RepID=A0A328FLI3_9BACT|nr:conjugal transfer protein TrbH [Desulfobacter hydrogenophilus]NDY73129.1 conjugal transfer protein TrbH [Desulfobacter hydrogenophilus]QBH14792.1 conjugal transfer protein TrbH [Desulfobacter hydrogenophilus]RAM03825.1 conjugal transfer protein TrbH [Desulfobacter hydrogenophilus]
MKPLTRLTLLFFLALTCFSCTHLSSKGSWVSIDSEPPLLICDEIISRLILQYPPAKTTITLLKSGNKTFDELIEKQARRAGYTISQTQSAVKICYVIDVLSQNPGTGYVHLKSSDGFSFSRMFRMPGYNLADNYTQREVKK